jgi:hypothetical protein
LALFIEINLLADERIALQKSAAAVQELTDVLVFSLEIAFYKNKEAPANNRCLFG